MQTDWSFLLNVVLLGIILSMIALRLKPFIKSKFKLAAPVAAKYVEKHDEHEDIISVRKLGLVDADEENQKPPLGFNMQVELPPADKPLINKTIMLFLSARGQQVFAGYELLQTLLTCGLRFGDAGLFHRHQHASGQGPVLFSLAAATTTGMFDLQNMGSMMVKGLCMFMELSGNSAIDHERYELFMQTARQLAEELHADLLDERQRAFGAAESARFEEMIYTV